MIEKRCAIPRLKHYWAKNMGILNKISKFFFPDRCAFCGDLSSGALVCDECIDKVEECLIVGETCLKCGNVKQKCDCNRINYLFSGTVGAFYNIGIAKQGVYGIKMANRPFAAKYFGKKMAEDFKERFKILPDIVCSVPCGKKTLRERGYNHADLLGSAVANNFSVKYNGKILKKIKNNKPQHTLAASERSRNVKGVYKATMNLEGKTVLLVDDIKTTGSTLNECAKQLRLNGAKEVYCAVALISNMSCKDRKNKI